MNTKKNAFILFFLVAILSIAFFFIRLKRMTSEMAKTREELQIENPAAKILNPSAAKTAAAAAQSQTEKEAAHSANLPNNFSEKLNECFPALMKTSAVNPQILLENLKDSVGLIKTDFQYENFHLDMPNGEERRIQLLPSDQTQGKDKKEVRLFKLDAEGLPQPIKLTREQRLNSTPDVIEKLKSQGVIKFHQLKETLFFQNGLVADVEWINDGTKDAQMIWNKKILSCRLSDCSCR